MKDYKAIAERAEKNLAELKSAYETFSISPKYVKRTEFYDDLIILDYEDDRAIISASLRLDREGYITLHIERWCAVTPSAKKRIEAPKFENGREALVYALETIEKINSFFD